MTDTFPAFDLSPVPVPALDAEAPELFRGVYGFRAPGIPDDTLWEKARVPRRSGVVASTGRLCGELAPADSPGTHEEREMRALTAGCGAAVLACSGSSRTRVTTL